MDHYMPNEKHLTIVMYSCDQSNVVSPNTENSKTFPVRKRFFINRRKSGPKFLKRVKVTTFDYPKPRIQSA